MLRADDGIFAHEGVFLLRDHDRVEETKYGDGFDEVLQLRFGTANGVEGRR